MAQVQDRILPHVQVRAFLPSERGDAMAWVSQPLDKAERDGPEPLPEPTPSVPPHQEHKAGRGRLCGERQDHQRGHGLLPHRV